MAELLLFYRTANSKCSSVCFFSAGAMLKCKIALIKVSFSSGTSLTSLAAAISRTRLLDTSTSAQHLPVAALLTNRSPYWSNCIPSSIRYVSFQTIPSLIFTDTCQREFHCARQTGRLKLNFWQKFIASSRQLVSCGQRTDHTIHQSQVSHSKWSY